MVGEERQGRRVDVAAEDSRGAAHSAPSTVLSPLSPAPV